MPAPSSIALDSPLGKASSYISTYSPELLFPIPRIDSRKAIGITEEVPFQGLDIWTGYELSWLDLKGKPKAMRGEFYFPMSSQNLIESKSFKLYLNSFNQSQFASVEEVRHLLKQDLSAAAQGDVEVRLFSLLEEQSIECFSGICLDGLDIETDVYDIEPAFLQAHPEIAQEKLYSHLLKSNCLVTGQPDWASVAIHYQGPKINHEGLLKYLISFRNHQGFHEQCVEKIFIDILHRCHPTHLTVYARYTRRGGLDINPFRSNFEPCPTTNMRLTRQ